MTTYLKKRINLRRLAIFLLGMYCVIRGIAYLPLSGQVDLPKGLETITELVPIEVWGGFWFMAGIICIAKTFIKEEGIAIPLATGLMAGWGTAYFIGWIIALVNEVPSRGWLTASSYIIPAIVIGILSAGGGDEIDLGNNNEQ